MGLLLCQSMCLMVNFVFLLQYIKESGVGYVVSGAGNFIDPDTRHREHVPRDSLKFFSGKASTLGGFAHIEIDKEKMTMTFIQARGTSLYRAVLPKRDLSFSKNDSK